MAPLPTPPPLSRHIDPPPFHRGSREAEPVTGRFLPLHVTAAPLMGGDARAPYGDGVVVELVVTGPLWGAGHAHPL